VPARRLPRIRANPWNPRSLCHADPGAPVTYAITAGNTGNAFAIDWATGEITVANPLALDKRSSVPGTHKSLSDIEIAAICPRFRLDICVDVRSAY